MNQEAFSDAKFWLGIVLVAVPFFLVYAKLINQKDTLWQKFFGLIGTGTIFGAFWIGLQLLIATSDKLHMPQIGEFMPF